VGGPAARGDGGCRQVMSDGQLEEWGIKGRGGREREQRGGRQEEVIIAEENTGRRTSRRIWRGHTPHSIIVFFCQLGAAYVWTEGIENPATLHVCMFFFKLNSMFGSARSVRMCLVSGDGYDPNQARPSQSSPMQY
jgi:hypothetical protein